MAVFENVKSYLTAYVLLANNIKSEIVCAYCLEAHIKHCMIMPVFNPQNNISYFLRSQAVSFNWTHWQAIHAAWKLENSLFHVFHVILFRSFNRERCSFHGEIIYRLEILNFVRPFYHDQKAARTKVSKLLYKNWSIFDHNCALRMIKFHLSLHTVNEILKHRKTKTENFAWDSNDIRLNGETLDTSVSIFGHLYIYISPKRFYFSVHDKWCVSIMNVWK
jgi:hypothetical protein